MQDRHPVGDSLDKSHVVLHHHQGVLSGQRTKQLRCIFGFRIGHAGRWLIKQQQMRLLHQQHADLKELFLAMGKQPRLAVAFAVKTQQAQHLIQSIVLFTAQPGAQAGPHRFISLHRQGEIFRHRQRFEDRRLLKLAPDALAGDGHRFEGGQIHRLVIDRFAALRPGFAGDHVHQGGLARAVGADHTAQLADANRQRQVRQRPETVKANVNVLQLQYRVGLRTKAIAGQLAGKQSFIRLH
ncbi:Uncharacterised protein [Klebsiella quasipneumoniae]|nr:Uncharacterised protein [Klebsiella quasipneumoniae]